MEAVLRHPHRLRVRVVQPLVDPVTRGALDLQTEAYYYYHVSCIIHPLTSLHQMSTLSPTSFSLTSTVAGGLGGGHKIYKHFLIDTPAVGSKLEQFGIKLVAKWEQIGSKLIASCL